MTIEAKLNGKEVSLPINSGKTGILNLTTDRGRFELQLPLYRGGADKHLGLLAAAFGGAVMVGITYDDEGKVKRITVYPHKGSEVIRIVDSGQTRVELLLERYKNQPDYR